MLLVVPLSFTLATRGEASTPSAGPSQSIRQALSEAFRHPSYVLLVLGFFTCGFQLAFVTAHMPAYLKDQGLPAWVGGWTLAVIGLSNAVGSLTSGWLSGRMPKRWLLSGIYLGRSVVVTVFILLPPSPATALGFGVGMGLLWLSTVPPTSSLVLLMFGTRYLAMLFGFAFFSHQLGGFLGVWLGGVLYERWAPTTRYGGSRWGSASRRRSSTCRSRSRRSCARRRRRPEAGLPPACASATTAGTMRQARTRA